MPQRDQRESWPLTMGEDPLYCPACGQALEERVLEADHRPRLVCPDGHVTWQNPRLVVGTLPVSAGRVLVTSNRLSDGAPQPEIGPNAGPSKPTGP